MLEILIVALIIFIVLYITTDKRLTPEDVSRIIKNKNYDYLVDVRTLEEWKEGHHEKAILIPIGEFVTELPKIIKDKNSKIVVYCRKGIRAEGSAKIAERLGFKNVFWMDGTYEELRKIK